MLMSGDPVPPVAALFPSHADRVRWDDYLTRELLCANERVAGGAVVPTIDMTALRSQLALIDFQAPRGLEELLPWTIAQLEHGVVHMTNPRYFGLFNPAPSFPALCGDRLTGAFNRSEERRVGKECGCGWAASPWRTEEG